MILIFFCALTIIIIGFWIIFNIINKHNNVQLDLTVSIIVPDILDIIDDILGDIDSVPNFKTFDEFKDCVINTTINRTNEFLEKNKDNFRIGKHIYKLLNKYLKEKIIKIINDYEYDSHMSIVYNRFKSLENGNIEEEYITNKPNEIINEINNFYSDDNSDFDV